MGVAEGRFVLAHGIGGARDLPIPLELAVAGSVAALVVSFIVLAVAWRDPRYDDRNRSRPAPAWLDRLVRAQWFRVSLRMVGLLLFGYSAFAAVFGQDLLTNPFFGLVYVLWWVGLVPASLAFGPVWRAISPVRTLHALLSRAIGADPDRGMFTYPASLGLWPAAVGLLAFVWMELVFPGSAQLEPLRLWCTAYLSIMLVGGALFGSGFYAHADPFEVYSTLVARLSVWGSREGVLEVRSPLANLAATPSQPGLAAVVAVLFGSTGFDSFGSSSIWVVYSRSFTAPVAVVESLVLFGFCLGVGLLFAGACAATGVDRGANRGELPDRFAHSLVPIVVGYVAAHYLSLLVNWGQQTVIYMSDPLGRGADWFGTADLTASYWLSLRPTLLASVKVLGVLLGHLLAVVAAHDRALTVLPRRHRLTGQLPLFVVMIGFTAGGVFLLFAS